MVPINVSRRPRTRGTLNPPRDVQAWPLARGPPCGRGKAGCLSAAFDDQGVFWSDILRAVHGGRGAVLATRL